MPESLSDWLFLVDVLNSLLPSDLESHVCAIDHSETIPQILWENTQTCLDK